jgi:hypothetical protein
MDAPVCIEGYDYNPGPPAQISKFIPLAMFSVAAKVR